MPRTTIRIEQLGIENPRVLFRIHEPANVPNANILAELDCNVTGAPFRDLAAQEQAGPAQGSLVREAGIAIYNRLAVHPGVKAALDQISNAAFNDTSPIFLQMITSAAEALPFETLFIPNNRFLALDDRSPIVRVAMANPTNAVTERLCGVPLKVSVVISAAGRQVYEEEEWRALYQAFTESSLEFQLQVLVGRTEMQDLIAQARDHRVTVQRIEGDKEDLVRTISEFEPVVLHFFCHGTTGPATYLEVGNRATHDLGDEPLYLSYDEVRRMATSLLLVTLNACEGATPVPDANSLALAIAEKAGVPVVVGMREAVDAQDANIFTGAFYRAFLDELHRVLSSPQTEAPNWPMMMRAPRDRLARRQGGPPVAAAEAHKRWSLPVLYMRPEEMRLRRTGTMEQLGEIQALRNLRSRFSKDTPASMLAEIDRRITELERELGDQGL